jgi:cysteine desulfurase/selenocysteine lyase
MIFSKDDFPLLKKHPTLSYLDNAATTQKPQCVIDAINTFYTEYNAPVHRGIYSLAEKATQLYEESRSKVAQYIGAADDEVIFTKGATESINLVAASWADQKLQKGDEIIITELEHHANLLPWMRLEHEKGIVLKYIPIKGDGMLDYDAYEQMITPRTKLVATTHTSNVLGVKVDLRRIIQVAHAVGARVLIDATQAAGRERLKVHELEADFVVFSGHKMLGPTGIGVLYCARHMHDEVAPYELGGGMVQSVGFHEAHWAKAPLKYEAGTPPIAQAIGLGAAIEYLEQVDFEALKKEEARLCARLIEGLSTISSIRLLGPLEELKESGHMVSFVSTKAHAHDIAAYLDRENICVRAGNHCAQPLHTVLDINATLRVSLYGYTAQLDIDRLVQALDSFSL